MMIIDKFTKFILSIIAVALCLNALNPWLSPALANANEDFAMERVIKKIAGGINKIADNIEKMIEIEKENSRMAFLKSVRSDELSIDDKKCQKLVGPSLACKKVWTIVVKSKLTEDK